MSELDPTPQEPSLDEQVGDPIEPVEEQDQTETTEGDEGEQLVDIEERLTHAENVADVVAQSVAQEPLNAVFPARFDTSGNFQELCVVNGSMSDMSGGRSSSGWSGIPMVSGQVLVIECEDYDASNSRSKMQFLLVGSGVGFRAKITAVGGSFPQWSYTVERVTMFDGTSSWLTDGVSISGVKNTMETAGTAPYTYGNGLPITSSSGQANGTACVVGPIGTNSIVDVTVEINAAGGFAFRFAQANTAW